jgi:hypothetical protein
LEDSEDLIDFTITSEESLLLNEFGKNTADSPNINPKAVLLLPQ